MTIISWIGLCDSILLACFKGTVGILTHSRALTASALYSLNDVISGTAVLVGLKIAKKPPDKEHPYGHGNVEFIVCVFTSILIVVATAFLMVDCIKILLSGEHAAPHLAALIAAVISVCANEIIYRYNICAVKHINSPALVGHAKHHRADAISLAAVVVAVVGSMLGYRFLDAFVAVFEAAHLIMVSIEILRHGGAGLMDRAIDESDVSLIRQVVSDMPDVNEVRDIRTRQIGRSVWVDLYVSLPEENTIVQVDAVSERIRRKIGRRIEHLGQLNVVYV